MTFFLGGKKRVNIFQYTWCRPGEAKHRRSALFYLKKIHQFFCHQERIRKTFTWKCFYCFDLNIVWKVCETGWIYDFFVCSCFKPSETRTFLDDYSMCDIKRRRKCHVWFGRCVFLNAACVFMNWGKNATTIFGYYFV